MKYRMYLVFIVGLTSFVIVGSTALLLWGIKINDPNNPVFDLEGASSLATVIPAFAGVLLAAFSVYMYIKVEDPLLKRAEEVVWGLGVLSRLLDDVLEGFESAIKLGKIIYAKERGLEKAKQDSFYYFTNFRIPLEQILEIFIKTSVSDFLLRIYPENQIVREFSVQISYYKALLEKEKEKEPITGAEVMVLVYKTCKALREILDGIDIKNAEQVCKVLSKPYTSSHKPVDLDEILGAANKKNA